MEKKEIYIINCSYERVNYGAVLTAYALQRTLNDMGEESKIIDNTGFLKNNLGLQFKSFEIFKRNRMKFTEKMSNLNDLYKLNETGRVFITGSDQVFRIPFVQGVQEGFEQYFLNFVNPKIKKIALSASLGVYKEQYLNEADSEILEKVKHSLKTFDYISVREKSGAEICKEVFETEAKHIIDPVFWLSKEHYEELASESKGGGEYKDKIVSYYFHFGDKKKEVFDKISKKYGCEITETFQSDITIEEWLRSIKESKLFITNSFHGMCFAIILNKPFICIINSKSGRARNLSVTEMLGIKDGFIGSVEEILERDCVFDCDYGEINKKTEEYKKEGINFLKSALSGEVKTSVEKYENMLWLCEKKICTMERERVLKNLIKQRLWKMWLSIYHKYLPKVVKQQISYISLKAELKRRVK